MENENRGEKVEMEELLVNAVRERPFLYDKSDPSYKDKVKKRNAWKEIGAGIQQSAGEASKLWNALRGQYTTYLGKLKKPSGSAAGTLPSFRHSKTMAFYQAFYKNYKYGHDPNVKSVTNLEEEDAVLAEDADIIAEDTEQDAEIRHPVFDVHFENFDGVTPPVVVADTPVAASKSRFAKKRKNTDDVDERLIAALEATASQTEDEFDHFGAIVACRVRKINSKNCLLSSKLQLEIQTILHRYEETVHSDDE